AGVVGLFRCDRAWDAPAASARRLLTSRRARKAANRASAAAMAGAAVAIAMR
ncbi:lysine transporter LysE, partial [Burkholderia pseudomallei]